MGDTQHPLQTPEINHLAAGSKCRDAAGAGAFGRAYSRVKGVPQVRNSCPS